MEIVKQVEYGTVNIWGVIKRSKIRMRDYYSGTRMNIMEG